MKRAPSGPLRFPFENSYSRKALVGFLIVSFIFSPLAPVFAQVDSQPSPAPENDASRAGGNSFPLLDSPEATPTDPTAPTSDSSPSSEPTAPDSVIAPTADADASLSEDAAKPSGDTSENTDTEEKLKEKGESSALSSVTGGSNGANSQSVVLGSFSGDRLKIDKNTGAMRMTYPIVIPPGRNGLQPDLALTYNSQDSGQGNIFGEGWSISIPYIERLNKNGLNNFYDGVSSHFLSSFDGELATTTVGSNYVVRTEQGAFNTYTLSGDSWVMTDKSGTKYTFGSSPDALLNSPSTPTNIYRWMLREVRDTNNNYITYSYFKDAGQIYPSSMAYTGNGTTPGIFRVDFLREPRSDRTVSAKAGFFTQSNYRVSEVDAYVSDALVRKYKLDYQAGDNSATSLLGSITETGRDSQGHFIPLPPVRFSYQKQSAGWTSNVAWIPPIDFISESGADSGLRIADANGDGLPDIIQAYPDANGLRHYLTFMNNGAGWTLASTLTPPILFTQNDVRIADVNGDGLPDIIKSSGAPHSVSYLNSGADWVATSTWNPPVDLTQNVHLADVNGDGLPDIVKTDASYLNNGAGWTATSNWNSPVAFGSGSADSGVRLADINGDGLPDILTSSSTAYLNNGAGWTATPTWNPPVVFAENGRDQGVRIADVNGDGLQDIVKADASYLNNGAGWTATSNWNSPIAFVSGGADSGGRIVDLNGDGLPDVVQANTDAEGIAHYAAYLNNNKIRTDILTGVSYAQGGSSAITYTSATEFTDSSGNILTKVPYPIYVVSKVTNNEGSQVASTLTYTYSGGTYYVNGPFDHQFAGFDLVTETDAAGNVTKTFYHAGNGSDTAHGEYQDNFWKIAKPYRVETYDALGNLYRKTINKWDHAERGGASGFVKLNQTIGADYDGLATHRDKAESYAYDDATGNQTQKIQWGEVSGSDDGTFTDIGVDKLTTNVAYAASSNGFSGKPSDMTVTDQSGTKIKETRYYYDNQSLGNATLGNLTKEERSRIASTYINTQNVYNSYGLVTQNLDPRGKQTNYAYDAYNLYPATVTNALGHTTQYQYDYASGRKTQVTDPNGTISRTVYDGLGRPLSTLQPDQDSPSTLVTSAVYEYTDTANAVRVRESQYLDANTIIDTYRYYDGLGRLVQTRKSAEDAGTYKVADRTYNSVGLVQKESLPYFASGASLTPATDTAALFTAYTYDPLGRVLTALNAVGTVSNTYANWKTTTTDARGNPKDEYADAYGNLVRVDEHNGASTYSTYYAHDGIGNLTTVTDALGNVRNFTYDGLGRRLTAEDLRAEGDGTYGTWSYTYDDAGNVTQTVDPEEQTVIRTYDDINRILAEDGTSATSTEATYAYDTCAQGIGRLCVTSSTDAVTSNAYNALGRLTQESKTVSSTASITSYTYDRAGNQLVVTNPDGSEIKYTYNGAGLRETEEKKELGADSFTTIVSDIDYSPMDQVAVTTDASGTIAKNTYDPAELYRLASKITTNSTNSGGGEEMLFGDSGMQAPRGGEQVMLGDKSTQALLTGPLPNQPRELYVTPLYKDARLISYYRFEDGGTDSKGGNHLNSGGGARTSQTVKVFGRAADFANSPQDPGYFWGGNPSNLNFAGTESSTISLWVNFGSSPSNAVLLGKMGTNPNNVKGWAITVLNGQVYFHLGDGGGRELKVASGDVVGDGMWHFVTITYDGSKSANGTNFYIDGTLRSKSVARNTLAGSTSSTASFVLGTILNTNNAYAFTGYMDDLAIFSRVLTAEEIANLYTGNWNTGVASPTSLGQFHLDGTTSIGQGSSTNETGVVFKAVLNSTGSLGLQLQVEVQPMGKNFTNIGNGASSFVAPGSTATSLFSGDIGGYHWQARTVDTDGNFSPWQKFSASTYTTDFIIGADTFYYTGSVQKYTVPPGVKNLAIVAYGAQGGAGARAGGAGGKTTGILSVTPGTTYYVNVGKQGGASRTNDNGLKYSGGGGGGMTWFSKENLFSQSSVLLVSAGGGGGGGFWAPYTGRAAAGGAGGYGGGGNGGDTNGSDTGSGGGGGGYFGGYGAPTWCNIPGAGGTQSSGYAAGQGGAGITATGCGINSPNGFGGAGGGLVGGNGGLAGPTSNGGGGGSSFTSSILSGTSTEPGVNGGNGYVVINAIATPLISLASLNQYRASGTVPLAEGESTNDDKVVFGATLNSSATSSVQLQVKALNISAPSSYVELSDGHVKGLYHLNDTIDSSGNNHTLTNNNSVTFDDGKFGKAADGGAANTNKYLSVASNLGIAGGPVSISAWFKRTGVIGNNMMQMPVGHLGGASPYAQEAIGVQNFGGTERTFAYRARDYVAGYYAIHTASVNDGAWHHLVLTYDGSTVTQWLDGVNRASVASSGGGNSGESPSTQILAHNSTDFFKGMVDEAVILDRPLTDTEIAKLYNNGAGQEVCVVAGCGGGSSVPSTPSISSLEQLKSDGTTPITEGSSTTGTAIAFKARLDSPSANLLQLEVQFSTNISFTNPRTATSSLVTAGSSATTTVTAIPNGSYYWRARALDSATSIASPWQQFGTAYVVDVVVKSSPFVEISDGSVKALYHLEDTADSSGNGNHLTNNGPSAFNTGKLASAADQGTNNGTKYLYTPTNFGITNGAISEGGWFKYNSLGGNGSGLAGLVSHQDNSTHVAYELRYNNDNHELACVRNKGGVGENKATYNWSPVTGTWYNIYCTYDGTSIHLYLNGVSVATSPASGNGIGGYATALSIGTMYDWPTLFISSVIADEVLVADRALTDQEIKELYNNGTGREVCTTVGCGASSVPSTPSLQQFKSDGTTPITEGSNTIEGTISFKGRLDSQSANALQLQIQLSTSASFTNPRTATSSFVTPGSFATAAITGISNGSYYWRARAFDSVTRIVSPWQQFGTAGVVDVVVTVPPPPSPYVELSDGHVKALYHLNDTIDSSGNNRTLTNNNGVTFDDGKFGKAADGGAANTNKYLSVANNFGIAGGPVSISAWFKRTGTVGNNMMQGIVGHSGAASPYAQEMLGVWNSAGTERTFTYRARDYVAGYYATYDNTSTNDGAWHHLVLTYDGSTVTQWLDGVNRASVASSGGGNGGSSPFVQILSHNASDFFKGQVDEVVILDRPLTNTEIGKLYNNGAGQEVCAAVGCGGASPAPSVLLTPSISSLEQLKSDGMTDLSEGTTPITEDSTPTEGTVSFKALLNTSSASPTSSSKNALQLQVQLPTSTVFTNPRTATSSPMTPGSYATTTITTTATDIVNVKEVKADATLAGITSNRFQVDTSGTLTAGLASYYKLEDTLDFLTRHDLTNVGPSAFNTGKLANAADFGTANTSKYLRNSNGLQDVFGPSANAWSLAGWIKMRTEIASGNNQDWAFQSESGQNNTGANIQYQYNGGSRRLVFGRIRYTVAEDSVYHPIILGTSTWHFVAMTWDGSKVEAWVDGSSVGTVGSSGTGGGGGNGNITFGANTQPSPTDYSNMALDEFGIWSKKLSNAEIANLYNAGTGQTMVTETTLFSANSAFVSPGTYATTSYEGPSMGSYIWQARVVDADGNASPWQEFGSPTGPDFIVSPVAFTYPTTGTTTPQFQNWLLNAKHVVPTHSYTLQVNWGHTAPNEATSSVTTDGTALMAGVSVPKELYPVDYTDTGEPVGIVAEASLYDITNGSSIFIASSSVNFSEETIHTYETCGSREIQCISYTYDANGNITRIEDASATDSAKTVDYTYDSLNRLVSAESSHAASGENFTETYSYDAIGNIVSGPRGTYVYEGNQGSSYANPHAVTSITNGSSTTSFSYDRNGNMTSGGDWTYGWDYKNRLISAGNGIATTTFAYGYDDQRIKKTSGGVDTIYVSKFYEVSGATTTVYIWAGDTLVATVLGNDTTYAHTDHLNSVAVTTDENGNIKSVKDFYPYGAERISSGESISRTFIGQISDTETDLQYLNARYYDSARGQFISQDPVFWGQQNLRDPQSLNSYSYANNNPIAKSDPDGRQAATALGLGGGLFVGATLPAWAPVAIGAVAVAGLSYIVASDILQSSRGFREIDLNAGSPQGEGVFLSPKGTPPTGWGKVIAGAIGVGLLVDILADQQNQANSTPRISLGGSGTGNNGLYWNQGGSQWRQPFSSANNPTAINPQQTTSQTKNTTSQRGGSSGLSQQQGQSIQSQLNAIQAQINQIQQQINNRK